MALEALFAKWKADKSAVCILRMGTVDYEEMTVTKYVDGADRIFKIKRTDNKNRGRPNASERFISYNASNDKFDKLGLINSKDLEWIAWNWRAWNNTTWFNSRKEMVFGYFIKNR